MCQDSRTRAEVQTRYHPKTNRDFSPPVVEVRRRYFKSRGCEKLTEMGVSM